MSEQELKYVKVPNFVRRDREGNIIELLCPVCGTVIAGITEMAHGARLDSQGRPVEVYERRFARFHNYAELKMQFEDGSYHVTNGCYQCLTSKLLPEQLQELYMADVMAIIAGEPMYNEALKARKAEKVVAVQRGVEGIV